MPTVSRLALTPLHHDDLALLHQWINDRDSVLLNASFKPVHPEQHQEWFRNIQQRQDVVIFAIRLVPSPGSPMPENTVSSSCSSESSTLPVGKIIGTCQLHSINYIHRSAELQIRLGDVASRGHGHGTTATRLLLDFAFRDLNLNRVYLHVFKTNTIAIRMYEKIGFQHEGISRQAAYINGTYVDVALMAILKHDYDSSQARRHPSA